MGIRFLNNFYKDMTKDFIHSKSYNQFREEKWELNEADTQKVIHDERSGKTENSISLSDLRKKYDV